MPVHKVRKDGSPKRSGLQEGDRRAGRALSLKLQVVDEYRLRQRQKALAIGAWAARPRRASEDLTSSSASTRQKGEAEELPGAESTCCTGPHDVVVGREDRFVGIFEPRHAHRLTRLIGSTSQRASG